MAETKTLPLSIRSKTPTQSESRCIDLITTSGFAKAETISLEDGSPATYTNLVGFLQIAAKDAEKDGFELLGEVLAEIVSRATLETDFGGYQLSQNVQLTDEQESDVLFLCAAYLEAMKHQIRKQSMTPPLDHRPDGRRGMTMTEKIFAMHDVSRRGWVKPGDVVQVDVDWVLASELTWVCSVEVLEDPSPLTTLIESHGGQV